MLETAVAKLCWIVCHTVEAARLSWTYCYPLVMSLLVGCPVAQLLVGMG